MVEVIGWSLGGMSLFFGILAVVSRNPVHAVLSLVLVFGNSAGFLLLNGVEFLGILLIVVYVGAIAVLFLFVVMMLDVGVSGGFELGGQYPLVGSLSLSFFGELGMGLESSSSGVEKGRVFSWISGENWVSMVNGSSSVESFGEVSYTEYSLHFLVAGGVLLIALIGAIVLTLESGESRLLKRQQVFQQMSRSSDRAIYKAEFR